jgi:hypothetical protein
MSGNVDADLTHHCDRLRSDKARLDAGALNHEAFTPIVTQEAFSHLAAR